MGFLKRLFAGDPRQDLERALAELDKGEARRALDYGRRAMRQATGVDKERATTVVAQAREALAAGALEKAGLAIESDYFDDAAEWLRGALEHVDDPAQRQELEQRLKAVEIRAREIEDEAYQLPELDNELATELDPDVHYQALVGMLVEDAADLYANLPQAFRGAYVDLNEGRVEQALAALDDLVAAGDDNPATRFERGRCLLLMGDGERAVADFEAVWEGLGDQPLDLSGELSVPGLWAEAMLIRGEANPVLDRLADLGDPSAGRPTLSSCFARALIAVGDLEQARSFLASAASRFGSHPEFSFLLASVLAQLGDPAAAADCLEIAIAPSCVSGQCAKPPKHLPSIRLLTALYLEAGSQDRRVMQLLKLVTEELGGHLTSEDYELLAKHHQLVGEPEAAELAATEARRLRDDPGATRPGALALPRGLGQTKRAAL